MTVHLLFVAIVFWLSIAVVAYVYMGYPLTLLALPQRRRAATPPPALPHVTVLIAAHNEVSQIAATVRNKLAQDYPPDLLDIIVISDGSIDGTDDVVKATGSGRVTLLRQEPRQGKTLALNRGVDVATGDILVFSDANSQYEPDTIRRLVAAFDDATVGYATGRLIYEDPGETAVGGGSGMYMRYENWLRRLETAAGSVVGVNGGVDAVRRRLYQPMRADHLPDFILPLRVVEQGYRVVYCDDAVSREEALGRQHDEYRMRVRVSLRALHGLSEMRGLMHPRYGRFAFQLFVHKVARYLMFVPLAAAFVANLALAGSRPWPYGVLLAAQAVCYVLAALGWMSGGRIRFKPVFVPFYFCLINVAAAAALVRFLRGERQVLWTPRRGA
jgi:cellulose synthase/poly-beta-1,6-N-acetylglucosamine synthase-like glycosyltransferase